MTATEEYIRSLTTLKAGELGLLRTSIGQGLDETLPGFDLFTGLWWPLRQTTQFAPRREVAWLVAKLYAYGPLPPARGDDYRLMRRLRQRRRQLAPPATDAFDRRVDGILTSSLATIETRLQWALDQIAQNTPPLLDWAKLTDDLSRWERPSARREWVLQYFHG